jgi:hypothetical protein
MTGLQHELASFTSRNAMSEMRDVMRPLIREAMEEGGKLALDSAVRITGRLVEKFTLSGHPAEALGASAAMEMRNDEIRR